MARDSTGGAIKLVLLLAGGFVVYRWWAGREPAAAEEPAGGGIVSELEALLDSMRRTSAGGPQPGDTNSVQTREEPAEKKTAEKEAPASVGDKLLAHAKQDPAFIEADQQYNVHQWNWVLRAVAGLPESETPDLSEFGNPLDLLSVDQFLARRALQGLSGIGGLGQFRRPLRRARYPVWAARPGGRSVCGCESTGCNCYRV